MADGTASKDTGPKQETRPPWQDKDGKDKTFYQLLQVDRDAEDQVIDGAKKRLQLKYHPDKNPGSKDAEEMSKRINAAYDVLSDPKKRAAYDAKLAAEEAARKRQEQANEAAANAAQAERARQQAERDKQAAADASRKAQEAASAGSRGAGRGSTEGRSSGNARAAGGGGNNETSGAQPTGNSSDRREAFLDSNIEDLPRGSLSRLDHAAGNAAEIARFNNWWEYAKWILRGKKFPKSKEKPKDSGDGGQTKPNQIEATKPGSGLATRVEDDTKV